MPPRLPLLLLSTSSSLAFVLHPGTVRSIVTMALASSPTKMSWSDPDWNWGSANGKAHDEALRLRKALRLPEQRQAFLTGVGMMDPLDWEDSKIVLALKCQRAAKKCFAKDYGLDGGEQQAWRSLMDDMAECAFEGYRGDVRLAEAIGDRLSLSESKRLASL